MFGPNFLVYISGQGQRDNAKVEAFAKILGLSKYDAKVMLGAPGPRRVDALAKEEEAEGRALELRMAGFVSFVINKDRFSRLPITFKALKAVENESGLLFTIERGGDVMELPQPKGLVRAVILGLYTQTTTHSDGASRRLRVSTQSKSHIREPFIHLYSEDPHTILEIRGTQFELAWLKDLESEISDTRWQKLAERFAAYYQTKFDDTLFRVPEEVNVITSALNVSESHGQASSGVASAGR